VSLQALRVTPNLPRAGTHHTAGHALSVTPNPAALSARNPAQFSANQRVIHPGTPRRAGRVLTGQPERHTGTRITRHPGLHVTTVLISAGGHHTTTQAPSGSHVTGFVARGTRTGRTMRVAPHPHRPAGQVPTAADFPPHPQPDCRRSCEQHRIPT
jgi:hypothetical protein